MSNKRNQFLAQYGTAEHLHKVIDTDGAGDYYKAHKLATENPELNQHHITKLLDSDSNGIRVLAALHPKLTDSHVEKIMNDDSYYSRHVKIKVMINDNISTHAIKKAYDNGSKETREVIGTHTFLPKELHQHVFDTTDDEKTRTIVKSRIDNAKNLDDFYDSIKDDPLLKH